jgi:hypothetical protein
MNTLAYGKIRELSLLRLDCDCIWTKLDKIQEVCNSNRTLTTSDLCLVNDLTSFKLTSSMLTNYLREKCNLPLLDYRKLLSKFFNPRTEVEIKCKSIGVDGTVLIGEGIKLNNKVTTLDIDDDLLTKEGVKV